MSKNIFSFLLALAFGSQGMAQKEAKQQAFQPLFDGKTTAGWHGYNRQGIGSAWQVVDGTLHFNSALANKGDRKMGGDIVTDEVFNNFHLKLEWKVAEGGNSGIMFNVKEDPAYKYAWYTGPEMQVLDNAKHPDARIPKHRAGDLYDLISCSVETVKPAGEWNKVEIIFTGNQLQFFLNGEKVVSASYGDDAWRALVAGSKFKSMPTFGTFSSGRICLQDHGDDVWYRNIEIRKL